jgi:choline dehydrogenase
VAPTPEETDYIVVGGGSAGAVLASRLSEDASSSVTLIEAGDEGDSLIVKIPAGFARMLSDPRYDWCYQTDDDATIDGRSFVWSAGKMLGGSSSINGQVYIRGSTADHARWVDQGCTGWSFSDCLPFYRRSENYAGGADPYHGGEGPLSVMRLRDPHPLSVKFVESCAERGISTLTEYCAGSMDGAFLSLCTQFPNGTRSSTASAHLRAARRRPNLHVLTRSFAEAITFTGRRASGVRIASNSQTRVIRARREVIVCASTVGSPALLMRSGIGPGEHLRELGIEVVCDRQTVGDNLQEHAAVPINKFVNVPTYNSQTGRLHMLQHGLQYWLFKKGPMVTPAVQAMALVRTRPELEQPDVQLHFLPLSYDIEPQSTSASSGAMDARPTVMISVSTCRPGSRGKVRLRSAKAQDLPRIMHSLLSDPNDVNTLGAGCNLIESIFSAPTWKSIVTGARSPPAAPTRTEDWEPYIRSHATICYHPVGTCRMGADPDAVVDLQLRVNEIEGLRVADASVMPTPPSANTNATSIMIGERAADLIRRTSAC